MALTFSLLTVTMILSTVYISYRLTSDVVMDLSREYTKELVSQIASNIETYIDSMDTISSFVQTNPDVQACCSDGGLSAQEREEAEERITAMLSTILQNRKDISLIAILDYNGRILTHDRDLVINPSSAPERQAWFLEARAGRGVPFISASHVQNLIKERYPWVISMSREIRSFTTGKGEAVLLVDLNFDVIAGLCSGISLGKRGYVFIVDRNGNIIYHPQQQLIYGNLKKEYIQAVIDSKEPFLPVRDEDGDRLYSLKTIRASGFTVVGVNYLDELMTNRKDIQFAYTTWGLAFLGATVIASVFISSGISKPIKKLRKSMQAVERGNFDIQVHITTEDEIGELGKDFNIMISKIKDLIRQNTIQQELKRKSELKALQAQINPHFLYNTLDSIIWMAESKNEEDVITMVAALARLFRLSISKGKEIITIGEEVEQVTQYLVIQKMRYKDKLDYRIDVDPSILPSKTVKIILQPLVENAIYHGIKNMPAPGRVVISGRRTGEGIELSVADNGVGMDREKFSFLSGEGGSPEGRIAFSLCGDGQDREPRYGLGILNVDERIKLYFGREYGLEFESCEGRGTTVRVKLPEAAGPVTAGEAEA